MIRGKRGNLKSVLQQRGFGDSVRELPPADPPASMLIQVEIEAIQPYDLNPRRTENPEFFARLCESILAQGLDNPIPITRRPGEAHYRVAAGGNTRLKALQRLHEQSPNDERFAKVSCIFRPFTSEIDLITAHLRENELRDSLLFIDHAHAIVALKRRLEEDPETGGALSDAAYERWLLRMGHKVSRRDIRRMEYAVAWLDEAIPVALRRGGGPRLIDIIGNLHR
jgi:ParB family protein of integrating conjugative element (PFGI_1 class)